MTDPKTTDEKFRIQLTDAFGAKWLYGWIYTGPTARENARAAARYIRSEIHRSGFLDRGTERHANGVQVVSA